jgi:hypothetical protein
MGFVPIEIEEHVRLFLKRNKAEKPAEVTARVQRALRDYRNGIRCSCGEPIWVIGSAEAGNACFTCITGDVDPSEDYEIAEACDKWAAPGVARHRRQDYGEEAAEA